MPKVSVILPTYNRAAMLPKAIESVLAQTFKDWELLVIDDGSTDEPPKVLRDYEKRDSRIRGITQKNSGICKTRHAGIRAAQGALIAFLDDDDTFTPDKLEKQVPYLDSHPGIGMVYSHVEIEGEGPGFSKLWPDSQISTTFQDLIKMNSIPVAGVLARKAALLRTGDFPLKLKSCDDYYLWLTVARFGKIDFLPGVVGTYSCHAGNMSRNTRQRSKSNLKIYLKLLKSDLPEKDKKMIREHAGFKNYMQASDALEQKRFDAARYHFLCALLIDFKIGLMVPWNSQAPAPYRFLRPYFGLVFSMGKLLIGKK
jgi:glycosyltransferase involved in cell wall biosynthesis